MLPNRKGESLTQAQLEYLAAHLSEISEDGLEDDEAIMLDETEDPDIENFLSENILPEIIPDNNIEFRIEDLPIYLAENMDGPLDVILDNVIDESDLPSTSVKSKKKNLIDTKKINWRKENLVVPDENLQYLGASEYSDTIMSLSTPLAFFNFFFSDSIIESIVEQSNLYSVQKDTEKPANLDQSDIKKFIGICLYSSVVHMPSVRHYWSNHMNYERVSETMSLKHFEKIRRFIHFNDNNTLDNKNPKHDRLHKIRPLIESLKTNYKKLPFEQYLSVDEQLCSTKCRHLLLQYIPMKPHKWGFKFFVVSGVSGYSYDFEIYTGQENEESKRHLDEPDIGASGNVVVRLLRDVPKHIHHRVYFDNYYTSLPLIYHLEKNGIHCVGTARRNRIPKCPLPSEADIKKDKRGTSYEYITDIDNIKISSVLWKDTKAVILLSSFCGELPKTAVRRFDKTEKKKIHTDCPKIVKEYNRHMGGVDLTDSLIGRYKIKLRSKKWYMRIFYHLLDLTMVNAWILYRKVNKVKGETKVLPLCDFKAEVAECLCKTFTKPTKRGRPSLVNVVAAKRLKKRSSKLPPEPVRTDSFAHSPYCGDKRGRCKMAKCKGFSYVNCRKCKVSLCLNRKNNCFENFHQYLK